MNFNSTQTKLSQGLIVGNELANSMVGGHVRAGTQIEVKQTLLNMDPQLANYYRKISIERLPPKDGGSL